MKYRGVFRTQPKEEILGYNKRRLSRAFIPVVKAVSADIICAQIKFMHGERAVASSLYSNHPIYTKWVNPLMYSIEKWPNIL